MTRAMQWMATAGFLVAGVLLLCEGSHAATAGESRFTPTRFTVLDQGTPGKPDVVLIPGLGSSRDVWAAEAKLLSPNYRLHLLQVGGFAGAPVAGNAAAPLLPGIVDELHQYISASGMHPAVMGHSLGGLLSLMLADRYPGDVRKIIIVDSLPSLATLYMPRATPETVHPMAEGMKAQMTGGSASAFAAQARTSAAAMVKDPALVDQVTAESVASDRGVFAEAMAEDLETDLRDDVASIKTPALLLYPFDNRMPGVTQAQYDALYEGQYKSMPNVTLVRVDDSRHFIMYDQPEKFDELVQAFLK